MFNSLKRWYFDEYSLKEMKSKRFRVEDSKFLDELNRLREKKKVSRVFIAGKLYYLDWFWRG